VVSADVGGIKMPNPEFILKILQKFPHVKPHEAFIVGDKINRCLAAGHMAGIRTVYFSNIPQHRDANCKAMAHGAHPDFSILDFRQIPYIIEVMQKDCEKIGELGIQDGTYRKPEIYRTLPSAHRIKVGLLIDGNGEL